MGNCSVLVNNCIAHHSKELYIENEEKRFQRAFPGYKDTLETKNKRRQKFEQEFLEYQMHKEMETKMSDTEKIENYKRFTAAM